MSVIVVTFGLVVMAMGVIGMAAPEQLIRFVRSWQSPGGLYVIGSIRLVLGAALFFAAPGSRAPEFARALGIFVFLIGIATPLFGVDRFRRLLDWWSARGHAFVRAWAGLALAFGFLLIYLVVP